MILQTARKLVVLAAGGTVLLLGVIMLVAPGPGIVGTLAGLAILATEFVWARTLLKRAKAVAEIAKTKLLGSQPERETTTNGQSEVRGARYFRSARTGIGVSD